MKLEGIKKLWGKEGYLPKKEGKTGDETEAPSIPQESKMMENKEQNNTRSTQCLPEYRKEEKIFQFML